MSATVINGIERTISLTLMNRINWNGCWEVRDGRTICRWMVAWKSLNNTIVGCIGGYSGGGTFQLEKFRVANERILTSDKRAFEELSDEEISTAEDCQDEVVNFHDQTMWLDCDNLVLASKCAVNLQGREDLLFGGEPLPSAIIPLFSAIGLISRPSGKQGGDNG